MSFLTLIQNACRPLGLAVPVAVMSSTDALIVRLVGIANEEGQDLIRRYDWQAVTKEATFTTVAAESQGTIADITGETDFNYMITETFWNRDLRRPVFGPVSDQQWEQLKAQQINGPWNQYIIRENEILFFPVPAAGQTCAFKWVRKSFCRSASGTYQTSWAADSDVGVLDEDIMVRGIVWRWKQALGMEYAEDFNKYEAMVNDAMGRDGSKARLNLHGTSLDVYPGVIVPSGNWVA